MQNVTKVSRTELKLRMYKKSSWKTRGYIAGTEYVHSGSNTCPKWNLNTVRYFVYINLTATDANRNVL